MEDEQKGIEAWNMLVELLPYIMISHTGNCMIKYDEENKCSCGFNEARTKWKWADKTGKAFGRHVLFT